MHLRLDLYYQGITKKILFQRHSHLNTDNFVDFITSKIEGQTFDCKGVCPISGGNNEAFLPEPVRMKKGSGAPNLSAVRVSIRLRGWKRAIRGPSPARIGPEDHFVILQDRFG
jgi:hypothetical protein